MGCCPAEGWLFDLADVGGEGGEDEQLVRDCRGEGGVVGLEGFDFVAVVVMQVEGLGLGGEVHGDEDGVAG